MSAHSVAPGAQAKRLAAYLDRLARAAEHADRATPLKSYCTGLLLPGERKSVEPMAARLYPNRVRQAHQSMHHIVADAAWSDEDMLEAVRAYVLPQLEQKGPIVAWIVDDTGFVKKGLHSVDVTRQYCGQVGKQENCRVAVSLSVSTERASLPIAWRLYLPEVWAKDGTRRKQTGVPAEIRFQTKPAIALEQIRTAVKREIPPGVVLADAAYGTDTKFREEITDLGLCYVVGIMSSVMETGSRTAARCALERNRAAHEISSAQPTACPDHGERFGFRVAAAGVEETILARSNPQSCSRVSRPCAFVRLTAISNAVSPIPSNGC